MKDKYKSEITDPGDRASQLAKEVCFGSHKNCLAVEVIPHQPDNFRGPVGFTWNRHILKQMMKGVMLQEIENDGAGGKPQFFTLVGTPEVFRGLGREIIAMTADDFARSGRFPVIINNEINVKGITEGNFPLFWATIEGYGTALRNAMLVNITGEVAIMKHSITAFCDSGSDKQLILTWGASCIGLSHHDLLIDGSKIRPNMPIIGFWEPGYRCNGGTFFTNLILRKFGPDIEKIMNDHRAIEFARKLTIPSKSYARTICRLIGWQPNGMVREPLANIVGIAHITGGGVWGKFSELLPEGVGATLDNMPKPAEVLLEAQELSWNTDIRLTDHQAYGTLHGGCGMLLIVEQDSIRSVIEEARKDGISAQRVGTTIASKLNQIVIFSRFKERGRLSSME